jgi:hypothetical protein
VGETLRALRGRGIELDERSQANLRALGLSG